MAYGQNMNAPMSGLMGLAAMKGRMGDNTLVHVNPMELKTLDALAGPGGLTQNPVTGLPEAFKIKDLLPALLAVAAPFAVPIALGGAGVGAATTGLAGALAAGTGAAAGTALTGGNREEILASGLLTGLTAGALGGTGSGGAKGAATGLEKGAGVTSALPSSALPSVAPAPITSASTEAAKTLAQQQAITTAAAPAQGFLTDLATKSVGLPAGQVLTEAGKSAALKTIGKQAVGSGLAAAATTPALYEIPETKTKGYQLPDTLPYVKREQVASKEDIDEFIRKGGATPQFFNYSPVQIPTQMVREGGDLGEAPVTYMATGGDTSGAGMFTGMVEAPQGDGMSDNVSFEVVGDPQIKQAMLSPDEYVMDAFTVAALGNGSSDAGAEKLDEFRKALREKVYGKEAQPKQVDGAKELSRLT